MAEVAIYSMPEKLYRYRTVIDDKLDRELKAIEEGYVYCPKISAMNDPMEGVHDENRFMRALKTYKHRIKEVKQYLDSSEIASLSDTNLSEPMWAYYAGNFSGICVEYHLSNLVVHLDDDIAIVRMHYSETAPTFRANRDTPEERARMALSSDLDFGQVRGVSRHVR